MQLQELIAGDSLSFPTSVPDYPAGAGWVLKYRLVPSGAGNSVIDLTAVAEGDDFRVQAAAATTKDWAADRYTWSSWVERAGESYTVGGGQLVVAPDPRTLQAGHDGRSAARKALDDAKAALRDWNPTVRRYKINDREREFASTADIIKFIKHLEDEVRREDVLAGRTAPALPRRILTRL